MHYSTPPLRIQSIQDFQGVPSVKTIQAFFTARFARSERIKADTEWFFYPDKQDRLPGQNIGSILHLSDVIRIYLRLKKGFLTEALRNLTDHPFK
jgi:hypothetical protein